MTMRRSASQQARLAMLAVVAGAWLSTAPSAAAQAAEGSFERTLKVTGPVELNIQSGPGGIHVRAGAADTSVTISARIRPSNAWLAADVDARIRQIEKDPPIEQAGNVIHVGRFKDPDVARNISITYDVTVPRKSSVTAKNGSGAISVSDLAGPVDASTGSGGITIERVGGSVAANTGSGRIAVTGASGLKAKTGSGGIQAMSVAGDVTATSGSGSIRLDLIGKGAIDVSSSSGAVAIVGVDGAARVSTSSSSLQLDGRPAGAWTISSSSGQVTLHIPPDAAFDVDAHVSSGKIETTHPITVKGTIDKRSLQGQVRGGGPLVSVRTSSGGIRIQ